MKYGFYLFIDEAGDEGLDRVRPIDAQGSSEYFLLCGVLVRAQRRQELFDFVKDLRERIGLLPGSELHFSHLNEDQQTTVVEQLGKFRVGLVAIVSNKRNMRGYRNLRCEARHFEIVNGRKRPAKHNWFYNGLFRYLLERASAECARWTYKAYGENRFIKIVFARRKGFSYSQTASYLYRLQIAKHGPKYFNNRKSIDWSVVHPLGIESLRPKNDPGLQIADCAASAIFRAIDEDWFRVAKVEYMEKLSDRFIRAGATPRDHGFKLLPDGFTGPLSENQKRSLRIVGYTFGESKAV